MNIIQVSYIYIGNDFYENKKQEIGNLLNLTKQTKQQYPTNIKIKFWEDDRRPRHTSSPMKTSLKLSHNIIQKFNEIDSKNTKKLVFNRTDGWNKPNKYN